MATGDLPAPGSEQVTTAPAGVAEEKKIPLPPPSAAAPAPAPTDLGPRLRVLDGVLVFLVLAFAFVAASFKATNSDLFLHLSAGRLIALRNYPALGDPFSYAATGTWVNHSWLYEVGLYLLYRLGGPAGVVLVVVKALLVVLLAEVLLRASSRPGQRLWVPAICTLLALLALSPRLLLQPIVFSYLFLGLTVYLLAGGPSKRLWLLPLICLVWVNFDEWFFLGPLTIALYLMGEIVQARADEGSERPQAGELKTLGLVLVASLAACLVNPYHVRAFTLPVPLDPTLMGSDLAREGQFRGLFLSPFQSLYFQKEVGLTPAGLSWLVLLATGLVSFVLTFGQWRWWRLFVWLVFAILAAVNMRCIPFFAVVAGPIAALNFLDMARVKFGTDAPVDPVARRWAVGGRLLTALGAVALVVTSLPGWLQSMPWHIRQVAWGVEVDEGLKQAAERIAFWREQGVIEPGQKWFNITPEVVYYLAWFAPGEKGFVDQRLSLFKSVGGDYVKARRSLIEGDRPEDRPDGMPGWIQVLNGQDARYVFFHAHRLEFYSSALQRFYFNPHQMVPCFIKGRTAVFAWNPPGKTPTDPRLAGDFRALAFGADALQTAADGPPLVAAPPWYKAVLELASAPAVDGDTAWQHYYRFEAQQVRYHQRHAVNWEASVAASLVGLAAQPHGPLANGLLPPLRMDLAYLPGDRPPGPLTVFDGMARELISRFVESQDPGPVDALYLAIRAARTALRENPDDARTWLMLAQAYSRLSRGTRERQAVYRRQVSQEEDRFACLLPQIDLIRQSQIVWALNNVLKRNPRPEVAQFAHLMLAQTYLMAERSGSREYFQLGVKHYKEVLRLARLLGMLPQGSPQQFKELLGQLDTYVKKLDTALQSRRNQYTLGSVNKPVLQQVGMAMDNGLAETAVEVLIKADRKDLEDPRNPRERPGATYLVYLLLGMGRLEEAREILLPVTTDDMVIDRAVFGLHPRLGIPAYEWFLVQMSAANGDYDRADEAAGKLFEDLAGTSPLKTILRTLELLPDRYADERPIDMPTFAAVLVGQLMLREAVQPAWPWKLWQTIPYRLQAPYVPKPVRGQLLMQGSEVMQLVMEQKADLWAVRAWLALEQGQTGKAREYAQKSLDQGDLGASKEGVRHLVRFRSQPLVSLCLERLNLKKPAE